MKRFMSLGSLILIGVTIISCCGAKKTEIMKADQNSFVPGPKVIIYQTKKDYSKFVPIILSDDKKSIESYPDTKDIYFNGNLAYPTQLHKGYWLDNRGISKNIAFINVTYDEYSSLPQTPSPDELMKMVIDTEPVVRMYSCGIRGSYKDIESELNTKIDADNFSSFYKIK